jgi:plastocyanin
MEETLFYVFGIALVLSALVLSAVGLRSERFPASRAVLAGVVAYFVVLVGATATFAVLNAREEQRKRDAEHAEEAAAAAEQSEEATGVEQSGAAADAEEGVTKTTTGTTTTSAPSSQGGETLKVSSPADGSLVFNPGTLAGKPGKVTIDYDNPSPVPHSIAIEEGGQTLDESETAADATLAATADLKPGKYVYFCTVPGHREAGMEGTLTIK